MFGIRDRMAEIKQYHRYLSGVYTVLRFGVCGGGFAVLNDNP
jgi:hypothetical protein